jgi:Tol biopolymer transport system component
VGRGRLLVVACLASALVVFVAGSAGSGAATWTRSVVRANGDIAFTYGGSLLVANPNTLVLRSIASCPGANGCGETDEPAWSPNGNRLAFVRGAFGGPKEPSHMSLYLIAANGGAAKRLATCGSCGRLYEGRLGWSPNGKWIAYSRDAHTGTQRLWIVPSGGGNPHRLTHCDTPCVDINPSWSPSGHLVVFERETHNASTLFTVRPNGSDLTKLAYGWDPRWSPDGRRIAFQDARGIEVANADGSDVRLLYAGPPSGPGVPSWSPNGKKLVFFNTPGQPSQYTAEVWTMNADGTNQHRLYHSGCCISDWAAPIWSPDGRMIAFAADSAGGTYVMNADGSGLKQLSPDTPNAGPSAISWQLLPQR